MGNRSIVAKLLSVQHFLNPLHVYCRFLDKGISKDFSLSICKTYEIVLFIWLSFMIKTVIYVYCMVNQSFRVREALKRQ
jgi:hypothetical protein